MPGQTLIGACIALAVEWIAHAGVVDMAHMHAYLMRAARKQVALDERIAVVKTRGIEALEDLKGRNGLARERIVETAILTRSRVERAMPVLMVPSSIAICP